jgi:hypothetical protein
MEKKTVMRSLLCLMNVTAMYRVLHLVVVEQDLQVPKEVELDLRVLKEVELDLKGLRVLLELQEKLVLLVLLELQEQLENKGYKVLQDLQDL